MSKYLHTIGSFIGVDLTLYKSIHPDLNRPMKKCKLSGCENRTSHNGGYCCGEHSKEHDRIIREEKKKK